MLDGTWRKSTYSGVEGSCVEVRVHDAQVQVRDTKQRGQGPVIGFAPDAWQSFVSDLKTEQLSR